MGKLIWIVIVLLCVCTGMTGCIEEGKVATDSPTAAIRTELANTPIPTSTGTSIPVDTQIEASPQPMPTSMSKQNPTVSPVPPFEEMYYEDRTDPTSLLRSYYNAVNRLCATVRSEYMY